VFEQIKIAFTGLTTGSCIQIEKHFKKKGWDALWRCKECCIVFSGFVINRHDDAVIFSSATTKVAHLEVKSLFRKPIAICDIMYHVHDVERVHDRSVGIVTDIRFLTGVIFVRISII